MDGEEADMKFLHLGDLHLGKSLGDFDLIDDQRYILRQILDIISKNAIDAVLEAGLRTGDIAQHSESPISCTEMGEAIANAIAS